MNRTRFGQGLSVNMIILIALGIVILVIAILMFQNSTQKGQEAAGNCELLGGTCVSGTECPSNQPRYYGTCSGDKKGYQCCSRTESTDATDKTRP